MAQMFGDATPVGESFVVTAPDREHAIMEAWLQVRDDNRDEEFTDDDPLHVEQLEAGKWEVVLTVAPPAPKPTFAEALGALATEYGIPAYATLVRGAAESTARPLSSLAADAHISAVVLRVIK
jgi:hypothetical protein